VYPSHIILLIEVVLCILFFILFFNQYFFFNIKFVIFGSLTLMMIQIANLELTRFTFHHFFINFILILFFNIRLIDN